MSYERRILEQFAMPIRGEVRQALLRTLLKHGGVVKEFAAGQQVVEEIADQFQLTEAQRTAALETIYRKQNRVKKALLWHRLLFRAADSLAPGLPGQFSRLRTHARRRHPLWIGRAADIRVRPPIRA